MRSPGPYVTRPTDLPLFVPRSEPVLVDIARRLDRINAPSFQIGIQFVQIGTDDEAAEHLRQLDDDLRSKHNVRDFVDTTLFDAINVRARSPCDSRAHERRTEARRCHADRVIFWLHVFAGPAGRGVHAQGVAGRGEPGLGRAELGCGGAGGPQRAGIHIVDSIGGAAVRVCCYG